MNREEIIKLMLDGFVEDMKFMYSNAGLGEEESKNHIEQGMMSFEYICSNTYERLTKNNLLK